jgi:DNA-binding XRE family transcriptional regulator/molybdate-binding protein
VGNRIADLRKQLGLTQTELALACGLTRPLISAVETDRHTPNVKAALAIAWALGTSVEELFGSATTAGELRPALGTVPDEDVNVTAVQVGDVISYHPVANPGGGWERADGVLRDGELELFEDVDISGFAVAGCDPALGLAASLLPARGPQRLVAIQASSAQAIKALEEGTVHAAIVHGPRGHLRKPSRPVRRFILADWQVGLAVRAGTPTDMEKLAKAKVRAVRRDPGAEAERALERRLVAAGGVVLRQGPLAIGHLDAARHVAYGSADVAATMEAAAIAYDLEFSPLEGHRAELRVAEEWESHPGARALLDLIVSRPMLDRLEALGGYDLRRTGEAA